MSAASTQIPPFPLARFSSLLGVRSTLLLFTALYLPRSSYLTTALPEQASSRDRPEPPFLRPLTADPLLTLAWLCLGVGVLQVWWAGWLKEVWSECVVRRVPVTGKEGDEERVRRSQIAGKERLKTFSEALMAALVASIAFYITIVLCGAPIVSYFSRTYLLALLLSILAVYPAIYTLGVPSLAPDTTAVMHRLDMTRLFAELSLRNAYERAVVFPAVGTVVGAWIGAFPIALDWDRPWQAWPLTPAYGAILGNIIASWAALILDGSVVVAQLDKESTSKAASPPQPKTAPSRKSKAQKAPR